MWKQGNVLCFCWVHFSLDGKRTWSVVHIHRVQGWEIHPHPLDADFTRQLVNYEELSRNRIWGFYNVTVFILFVSVVAFLFKWKRSLVRILVRSEFCPYLPNNCIISFCSEGCIEMVIGRSNKNSINPPCVRERNCLLVKNGHFSIAVFTKFFTLARGFHFWVCHVL